MSYWYLASVYSSYPGGKQEAHDIAAQNMALLLQHGVNVFCPITHSHDIDGHIPYDRWLELDKHFVEQSKGLIALRMSNWEESQGMAKEIMWTSEAGKPIIWMWPGLVPECFKAKLP